MVYPIFRTYGLFLILLFVGNYLSAQQYSFIQYSLKEGLVQSQVRTIYQDSRGYIWAGTLGGVSRFDGLRFVNYDRDQGLVNNQSNCIIELHDGTIAIGSVGGFSLLNSEGVKSIKFSKEFAEAVTNSLIEDNNKVLWIGTDQGLFKYQNGKLIYGETALAKKHVKSFFFNQEGVFFAVTKDAVYEKRGVEFFVFYQPENKETSLFDARQDRDGTYWLATKGEGVLYLKKGEQARPIDHESLRGATITSLELDAQNELWAGSRFGFFHLIKNGVEQYTESQGLPTPEIRDILFDREGNCWLATYGSGLLRFTGRTFSTYTDKQGLSSNAVMSITKQQDGTFWFSTFDRGVSVMKDDTITFALQKEIASNNRIWTTITTKDGALWLGSSDGLYRYQAGKVKVFTEADSLLNRMVLSLHETRNGRLYIGTADGLCYYENGAIHSLASSSGFVASRIRGLSEDSKGNLWCATRDGVQLWNGSRFEVPKGHDLMPEQSAYCVEVDTKDRVWVGTQGGLTLIEKNEVKWSKSISEEPGANTLNFIKHLNGQLWIGTLNGLYRLQLADQLEKDQLNWRHYSLSDGFRSLETNLNAVYADDAGYLWIGTPEGVVKMNIALANLPRERIAPRIVLSAIHLNLKQPNWSSLGQKVDPVSGLPIQLDVGYKNNHFTFYFDGISTTYPDEVKYQYMLEGFDEDWQAITSVNFATYSNLPYDAFTFRVRAQSADGTWSDTLSYSFNIRPPFWLRWWFILLEILAVGAIATLIVASRLRVLRARRDQEQLEMKSRMLILEQQSLNSSMNRHFIFNALNSIQYYINRQDRMAANRYLSDFAKLIRKNLDSSQENLTPLREEIERLELYLKLEHMRFKDKFDYEVSVDPSLNLDQVKVPAMLLQPFLENSIWHGLLPKEAPGSVKVKITLVEGHIEFLITDNGVGIEQSLKSKSGTDSHISKGMQITGNRIALLRKMSGQVIELQGPYQLNSDSGEVLGTEVKIVVPVNFNELFSN